LKYFICTETHNQSGAGSNDWSKINGECVEDKTVLAAIEKCSTSTEGHALLIQAGKNTPVHK